MGFCGLEQLEEENQPTPLYLRLSIKMGRFVFA